MALKRYAALLIILVSMLSGSSAAGAGRLIATVLTSDMPQYKEAHRAFVKALAARGFAQSEVEIVTQTPNPDPVSWANSLRKFDALKPELIVTFGTSVTIAAMQETNAIPIVFADVYGPVETGITRSMSKAGNNLCGVSSKVPMATLIRTMTDIRPIKTLGVLFNSREVGSIVQLKEMKRIAAQKGFAVVEANVQAASGLDTALGYLLGRSDCLFVADSSVVGRSLDKVARKAGDAKIPLISLIPASSVKGALVALEASPEDQGQLAADYAAKILSGKKPGEFSIATPRTVELIINMSAARALGLHVPFRALNAATKVLK